MCTHVLSGVIQTDKTQLVYIMLYLQVHTIFLIQGRCVGIIIGCTIGMAPLLWFDDPHKDSETRKEKH